MGLKAFFFWPCHRARGILVPGPDTSPWPPAVNRGICTAGPPGVSFFSHSSWFEEVSFQCPYFDLWKARLPPKPIISVFTAKTGLWVVPALADFVDVHAGWQNMSQSHMSWHTAECSGLTYLTLQLRTRSQGFYSNNWGADPAPNRTVATTEQRGGPIQHYSASSGQHSTKHTLHQGRIMASTC